MLDEARIDLVGDAALVVQCGPPAEIEGAGDLLANRRAVAASSALRDAAIIGVCDIVPTIRTVGVHFDPLAIEPATLVRRIRNALASVIVPEITATGTPYEVPVVYGGAEGPDLCDVAAAAQLSEAEVIQRHAGRDYRVYMIGFSPGFAYLGPIDPMLRLPRRPQPRTAVAAGSVAIAGDYTAIYPTITPGGWHLIGRTSVRPFELGRERVSMFQPGDVVRFVPADRTLRAEGQP
ncbi:MAG TPA: 5-oxoprolinase subunit PxpB [Vicinamibacterales bacterium]|jgi:KipI family sensor histidine kinase inhibitor|nr:5-oxoprolinase subunit PxpB [Vicinamibacterales bacterium]